MALKRLIYRVIMKIKHEALRIRVKNAKWQFGVTKEKRDPNVMISLTSYPKRFPELELCIKSLVNQRMKADRIILWLGNDASPADEDRLRRKYAPYGVEVRRDAEHNYLSHKKYYYAMRDFSNDIVVTADDDLIYPPDWLESLYRSYLQHPECISARRVHRVTWDEQGSILPYIRWPGDVKAKEQSHSLLATTGAGTLFPPGCLCEETINAEMFMKKAKTADDIWLKVMAVLSGVKVVWAKNTMIMPTTINLDQHEELTTINVAGEKNDQIFRDLCDHYHLEKKDFS